MNKALFLDRDGIINREKGYVYKVEDFEFIKPVFDVCRAFQKKGFLLFVITNQAGIGRGYYSEGDFNRLTTWMLDIFTSENIKISAVYFDPTHPEFGLNEYKIESFYRKPNPGMILKAQVDFDLDLSQSILVGDKISDIQAGKSAGVGTNILVDNDWCPEICISSPDYVVKSMDDVPSILGFES